MLSAQKIILWSIVAFLFYFSSETFAAYKYSGSVSFSVNQRFFTDENFKSGSDASSRESFKFNKFVTPQFELTFGLHEFSFGLEPIVGVSFVTKTSNRLIAENGLVSEDRVKYWLITGSAGARYKPYRRNFFWLIPYVETQLTYRYGSFEKVAAVPGDPNKISGGDFGAIFGAGLFFSFMGRPATENELRETFGAKDFGAITSVRYMLAGIASQGLGETSTTGGWDAGMGLQIEW